MFGFERNVVSRISLLVVVGSLFYITTFKILDRDFWWHITAGKIITQTKSLIVVDPFAHTREGLAYGSSHQWLAQVVFYGVWNVFGATGEILFRGLLIVLSFVVLLLMRPKAIWPNGFLILIAAYFNRPSFMDRPQLFSFLFFSCFLYASFYYLRHADGAVHKPKSLKKHFLIALVILQVLWVNMHGAAAIYGVIVFGALAIQRLFDWVTSKEELLRKHTEREVQYLIGLLSVFLLAFLVSPNGLRTFFDLFIYTSDQTLSLVREWQPRGVGGYLAGIGPFWILAIIALFAQKKNRIFSFSLLAVVGYLSLQSYRHGIFFIFAVLAVAIFSLSDSLVYRRLFSIAKKFPLYAVLVSLAIFFVMVLYARHNDIGVLQREGYGGYGVSAVAKGAIDFIEQNNIQGKMFNTYAIGDYLMYRGYPDRKVYVDGRNIDYGYDFLRQMNIGGFDPAVWKNIEDTYDITYAIIEYPLAPGAPPGSDLPYSVHLGKNPNWVLVYVDDKVAVYLKKISEHADVISKYGYRFIAPESLEFGNAFEGVRKEDMQAVVAELERVVEQDSSGIKSSLVLSHHFAQSGDFDTALEFAQKAIDAQPYRPEAYEALGIALAGKGAYAQAGAALESSLSLTGGGGLPVNYSFIADIFSRAGDKAKASYYNQKAK